MLSGKMLAHKIEIYHFMRYFGNWNELEIVCILNLNEMIHGVNDFILFDHGQYGILVGFDERNYTTNHSIRQRSFRFEISSSDLSSDLSVNL